MLNRTGNVSFAAVSVTAKTPADQTNIGIVISEIMGRAPAATAEIYRGGSDSKSNVIYAPPYWTRDKQKAFDNTVLESMRALNCYGYIIDKQKTAPEFVANAVKMLDRLG